MRPCPREGKIHVVKRRLFNTLAGVSLLLCIPCVVIWMRSMFQSRPAYLSIVHEHQFQPSLNYWYPEWGLSIPRDDGPSYPGVLGFSVIHESIVVVDAAVNAPPVGSYGGVTIPYWFLAFATATPVVLCIRRQLIIHPSRQLGICPICAYDLRATPDRCPECGTIPRRKTDKLST
jgi:hypothetical protein